MIFVPRSSSTDTVPATEPLVNWIWPWPKTVLLVKRRVE
jgi:hypothetical protein